MSESPKSGKERLDKLLVDRGLCPTRAKAQGLILAGDVTVGGRVVDKPGTLLAPDADISLKEVMPFVSRGGLKLQKALAEFPVPVAGRVCIDVGAATGGFTDCLLQQGAPKVYAVDVGYGQLDWKLRQDPRVVVMEQTNIRHLQPEQLSEPPALAVSDVSFISLTKVLPHVGSLLQPDASGRQIIALLKPQFEYKDYIRDRSFKGVVQGKEQHLTVVTGVIERLLALMPDWTLVYLSFSPVTGPKGNIEYLIAMQREGLALPPVDTRQAIPEIINKSYEAFGL